MYLQTRSFMRMRPAGQGCFKTVVRAMLLVLLSGLAVAALAQTTGLAADRIKAAYVYNFAKFIEFPAAEDRAIRVCVLGRDDLNGAMQGLNHRMAQGREIQVRKDVPMDQLKDCTVAFVGDNDARLLPMAARQLANSSVLLVSDARQAMDLGAHLSLNLSDDRVEFDVNLLNLQKSNIKASSQMLKLARVVIR